MLTLNAPAAQQSAPTPAHRPNPRSGEFTEQELRVALLLREAEMAANRIILGGIGWIAAGIIITWITYAMADPGESYFIFWGLSVYGAYRLLKGIYYRMSPEKLIAEALAGAEHEAGAERSSR
ncbi:MAG TPA: hypothetical protein VNM40_04340 [Candidatus Paceibacterota bacterium]|nr:hypothetical protein [Candidatus Paceibacterota bacterium]